ncbi:hydroxyethylthiazole kinase [Solibacillus isronensis]|uniref:hydroxyethylthiazole kinase n=1 Tax=Solibacillus isronensis TaxID=412383 RepID=UPI00203B57DB|nr:hydroxyethylthiazole kinase [Solibacillus isronensis]MCM3720628.1 hydroxyethylthiazole kinase [Solibacillus isronensis]
MSLQVIHKNQPLVHCITNYVVANFTANGLLAVGASPVMADAIEEVGEMAAQANALLLNMGTLNERTIESMKKAGLSANMHNTPLVFDPVGVGATKFRAETAQQLLDLLKINVIRCNIGEMAALAGVNWASKGVDSGKGDIDVAVTAKKLANNYQCIVIVTGEQDVITDGIRVEFVEGGHEKVTKMTGSGCLLSAFCAAVLANSKEPFDDLLTLLNEYKQVSANSVAAIGNFHTNFLNQLENLAEGRK